MSIKTKIVSTAINSAFLVTSLFVTITKIKYPKMNANVCVLKGKFDNGVLFNVSKLHSLISISVIPFDINDVLEIPIVISDDIIIPTNSKNPKSSPEKREDITKKATIINGIIL